MAKGGKGSKIGRRITNAVNENMNPTLDSGTWQDRNPSGSNSPFSRFGPTTPMSGSGTDNRFVRSPTRRSISSPDRLRFNRGFRFNEGGVVPSSDSISSPERFSLSTGGVFAPVDSSVISGSLQNVFNPMGSTGSVFGGESSGPSMMGSANKFAARTYVAPTAEAEAEAEYFPPTAEQDAMYRNMYNTTGYIPEGGYSTVYQDPNTLETIRYGERSHQVPMSWGATSYPLMNIRPQARPRAEDGPSYDSGGYTLNSHRQANSIYGDQFIEGGGGDQFGGADRGQASVIDYGVKGMPNVHEMDALSVDGEPMGGNRFYRDYNLYKSGTVMDPTAGSTFGQNEYRNAPSDIRSPVTYGSPGKPSWRSNSGGMVEEEEEEYKAPGVVGGPSHGQIGYEGSWFRGMDPLGDAVFGSFSRGGVVPDSLSGGFSRASEPQLRTQDYRGGGMVKPRMNRYQQGGMTQPGMQGPPMSMEDQERLKLAMLMQQGGGQNPGIGGMPQYASGGLTGAPEMLESMSMEEMRPGPPMGPPMSPPMGGPMGPPMSPPPGPQMGTGNPAESLMALDDAQLDQMRSMIEPEQMELVISEVKLALQGRHPEGDQLLAVVDVMYPGMIEQVAVSMEGTGDGMTDSQMALLAPGEYVMDARSVADLGNGSSDAGGRAMDRMVKEIREVNRGTSEQLPGMDPEGFFPMNNMA